MTQILQIRKNTMAQYDKIADIASLLSQPTVVNIIKLLDSNKRCTLEDFCQYHNETEINEALEELDDAELVESDYIQGKIYYSLNLMLWSRAKIMMIKFLENPSSSHTYF